MKTIENEQCIYFDVDDTLVMWGKITEGQKAIHVTCPYDKSQETLRPHPGHIKVLKDRKARGAHITVWSHAGYRWAEAVVRALGLTEYVDVCATKPCMYVDDKQAHEILGERLYIDPNSHYGT